MMKSEDGLPLPACVQGVGQDRCVGGLGVITGPFVFRNTEYKTASLALVAYIKAFVGDLDPLQRVAFDSAKINRWDNLFLTVFS